MVLNRFSLCALVLTSALAGCSGFGVVKKNEPLDKLNQAAALYQDQDRPVLAEILIVDAMKIAQSRDDQHMLGSAHREYADLLRSPSITGKWKEHYRQQGFKDQTVTYDNRLDMSKAYYAKAIEFYAKAAEQNIKNNKYDLLTNIYFNTAYSYSQLGDLLKACSYYDMTLAAHTEQVRRNPNARVNGGAEGGVPEAVAAQKTKNGCL